MNKKKNIFAGSDCPDTEVLLAYMNNSLSREEKHRVEEHLVDCEMCSDELEGLAAMGDTEKLPGIVDDIQQELGISEVKRFRIRPVYQLAAAVAVIFIVAGTIFLTEYLSDNGTSDIVSQAIKEKSVKGPSDLPDKSGEIAKGPEVKAEEKMAKKELSGKGMERSEEMAEVKVEVQEEAVAETAGKEKEQPKVSEMEVAEPVTDDIEIVMELDGAGVEKEELVFGANDKDEMIMDEMAGEKSRAVYQKSAKSEGELISITAGSDVDSAAVYYNMREHEKAINFLKNILKKDKENEKAMYEMALNYFELDDYKRSLKFISKTLEINETEYRDECELLLLAIISESSKYKSRAEKMLDSIK